MYYSFMICSSSFKLNLNENPFFLFRPKKLYESINFFLKNFNGKVVYPVKTNPSTFILKSIFKLGIDSFDVASIQELRIVKNLFPKSEIYFTNPVKSRNAIKEAFYEYNVRNFSLDSLNELEKILQETDNARDLKLFIRLFVSNNFSKVNLSKKFGIEINNVISLLEKVALITKKIGISFHVGSQCMNPKAYSKAIKICKKLINSSKIEISCLNVGGGFPSNYSDHKPIKLINYLDKINKEFEIIREKHKNIYFLAEPGRVLVSDCMSLIVRVELRKGKKLYINDGIYGSLRDAGTKRFNYPVKLIYSKRKTSKNYSNFEFYGPTCDSEDYMKGPFYLPSNIEEGDLIEIEQLGAYSFNMQSNFNGFKVKNKIFLDDGNFLEDKNLRF